MSSGQFLGYPPQPHADQALVMNVHGSLGERRVDARVDLTAGFSAMDVAPAEPDTPRPVLTAIALPDAKSLAPAEVPDTSRLQPARNLPPWPLSAAAPNMPSENSMLTAGLYRDAVHTWSIGDLSATLTALLDDVDAAEGDLEAGLGDLPADERSFWTARHAAVAQASVAWRAHLADGSRDAETLADVLSARAAPTEPRGRVVILVLDAEGRLVAGLPSGQLSSDAWAARRGLAVTALHRRFRETYPDQISPRDFHEGVESTDALWLKQLRVADPAHGTARVCAEGTLDLWLHRRADEHGQTRAAAAAQYTQLVTWMGAPLGRESDLVRTPPYTVTWAHDGVERSAQVSFLQPCDTCLRLDALGADGWRQGGGEVVRDRSDEIWAEAEGNATAYREVLARSGADRRRVEGVRPRLPRGTQDPETQTTTPIKRAHEFSPTKAARGQGRGRGGARTRLCFPGMQESAAGPPSAMPGPCSPRDRAAQTAHFEPRHDATGTG